jgi:hypothetical protein
LSATEASTSARTQTSSGLVRAYRVFAALALVNVLFQFITAGQLFPSGGPGGLHAGGAIVLHVLSGLAAVAAVVLWRRGQVSLATTALTVVVFGYTFLQAYWGGYSSLWIHVPGAMLLTVGVVWVLFASLRRP